MTNEEMLNHLIFVKESAWKVSEFHIAPEAMDYAIEKIKTYDYCYDSFSDTLRDLIAEGKALVDEAKEDFESFDQVEHLKELTVKTKLLHEVLCFMEESLEKVKKGGE